MAVPDLAQLVEADHLGREVFVAKTERIDERRLARHAETTAHKSSHGSRPESCADSRRSCEDGAQHPPLHRALPKNLRARVGTPCALPASAS
jgi:hypothetical protein